MNAIWPLAIVVLKELIRRKDFYVLFVLTALISILMGSINFFNTSHIARYLKEICLLLIWVSSLVIAITTAARQILPETGLSMTMLSSGQSASATAGVSSTDAYSNWPVACQCASSAAKARRRRSPKAAIAAASRASSAS